VVLDTVPSDHGIINGTIMDCCQVPLENIRPVGVDARAQSSMRQAHDPPIRCSREHIIRANVSVRCEAKRA